ncbi:MAG TPA: 4Fe-4S binding protein [Candidatus Azosocius sp. HAIN]
MLLNFINNLYRNFILSSYILFLLFFNCCFANDKNNVLFLNNNVVFEKSEFFLNIDTYNNLRFLNNSSFPIIEMKFEKSIRYYFYTSNIVDFSAYSGKPIELLIGLNIEGVIEDISLIKHSEPILLAGISLFELYDAVNFYKNKNIMNLSFSEIDIITGATVTSCILDETVVISSKKVAMDLGIISNELLFKKKISNKYEVLSWDELIKCGAIGHYESFFKDEDGIDNHFIDLYYTNIMPVSIGKNLFFHEEYDRLFENLDNDCSYILLMNNGSWSFKGSAFSRGGIYDRFILSQKNNDIRFRYSDYVNVNVYKLNETVPFFKESGLFIVKKNDFNLSESWNLILLLFSEIDNIKKYNTFSVEYKLPSKFIENDSSKYVQKWIDDIYNVILYFILWFFVIFIFIFKKYFSNNYNKLSNIKFFIYFISVFYFGFICCAQPSFVNLFALLDQNISLFLLSPLLFIGWMMIFITLIFWGRSFFCGWICPFGAFQELFFKVRIFFFKNKYKFEFSDKIHSFFKLFRYYIFVFLLLVFFLYSSEIAEFLSEIEPFKTVWNIGILNRKEYEFVIYSVILLFVSIFIYRFFCRYICPLGAFLSLLSKFSLIKIKRRNTCKICRVCFNHCESRAIGVNNGQINSFDCLACFSCINKMYDNKVCPPLVSNKIWIKYEKIKDV